MIGAGGLHPRFLLEVDEMINAVIKERDFFRVVKGRDGWKFSVADASPDSKQRRESRLRYRNYVFTLFVHAILGIGIF